MRNADTIVPDISGAIRWIARVMSILLVILIIIEFMNQGTGLRLSGLETNEVVMTCSLVVAVLGLLLGWIWEALGGILTLAGLLVFSIINHFYGGDFPWAVWIMGVPAILFVIYWWRVSI